MRETGIEPSQVLSLCPVEQFTLESGSADKETAEASKNGLMVLATKEVGATTKPMAMEYFTMQTVTYTKVNGKTIKPTGKVFTLTPMVLSTMASGKMTSSMALV